MTANTNRVKWGVDGGPDYTHCVACGSRLSIFPRADLCAACRVERKEREGKQRGHDQCRGGCGRTVVWHVYRCSQCREFNHLADPPSSGESLHSAVDWDGLSRSRGNAGTRKQREVELYLMNKGAK